MKNLLIIGATSEIARQFAIKSYSRNFRPILCGRNKYKLQVLAKDLQTRLCLEEKIPFYVFDITDYSDVDNLLEKIKKESDTIDAVFIASGLMYSQKECEESSLKAIEMINVNYTGVVNFLLKVTENINSLEFISVVSSVAGERGRLTNFNYGSTKSGVTTFMEGLKVKFANTKTLIQTVKPGPTSTAMTKGMTKLPFLITAEKASSLIWQAIKKKKSTAYIPFIWFPIMTIIKNIPEFIYKKLKL